MSLLLSLLLLVIFYFLSALYKKRKKSDFVDSIAVRSGLLHFCNFLHTLIFIPHFPFITEELNAILKEGSIGERGLQRSQTEQSDGIRLRDLQSREQMMESGQGAAADSEGWELADSESAF